MPPETAEWILRADFPKSEKDRVDALLEQKMGFGLSDEENVLLKSHLNADLILSILKSKACQALRQPPPITKV